MSYINYVAAAATAALLVPVAGAAQDKYPVDTVTMVVPYSAGGTADTVGRLVAEELSQRLGITVVVENVGGAGGTVGAEKAARMPADGSTLLLAGNAIFTTAPVLSDVPYDPVADFTPIANVSVAQRLLVANKDMPFKTFEEFVAYGKAHPGEMNYGSVGVGSTGHVATVDLLRAVGVEAMHIPYKGASDVVQAVLTGDIQFMLDAAAAAQVRQDTVTPLAVGGDTPKAEFPDIPTYADLGVDALSGTGWQMVMGPAGMPQEVVDQLIGALDEALKSPELLEKMDKLGLTARFIPGEELASALADESTKMDKILSDMGMKKK